MGRTALAAVVVLACAAGVTLCSIARFGYAGAASAPRVAFLVPDGFDGCVWVVADPHDGTEVSEDASGGVVLAVPANGVMRVRSDAFLRRPIDLSVMAESNLVGAGGAEARGVWRVGEEEPGVTMFFIGTPEQRSVMGAGGLRGWLSAAIEAMTGDTRQ